MSAVLVVRQNGSDGRWVKPLAQDRILGGEGGDGRAKQRRPRWAGASEVQCHCP